MAPTPRPPLTEAPQPAVPPPVALAAALPLSMSSALPSASAAAGGGTAPSPSSPASAPPSPAMCPTLDAATLPRLLDPALAHLRDVTLIPARSPGRSIRAHRFVLAAASPVLRSSLTTDPTASVLTLSHADADALDAALQYVYGKPQAIACLPVHALWTALATCVAYAIVQPLDAVQKRIVDSVDFHNVFYHWGMADKYNLDAVQLRCRNLVKFHFVTVSKQPEFLDVAASRLARVLRIHDLSVDSEDDVFQALERWLAFDIDARAEQALQLLRLVRLPTMSDRILLRVCRSPYFGGHNEFYQLLLEALIRRTEVRIVHAPRVALAGERYRKRRPPVSATAALQPQRKKKDADKDGAIVGATYPNRESCPDPAATPTGPVDVDASASANVDECDGQAVGDGAALYHHPPPVFKPLGVTDDNLLPRRRTQPPLISPGGQRSTVDYNRKEDRTVLFEGMFPLRWYKSVRFRPRSSVSLLFTVVIPKWSTCRRRFISESRSFLNHKWSLWVDPYSSEPPPRGTRDTPREWLHDFGRSSSSSAPATAATVATAATAASRKQGGIQDRMSAGGVDSAVHMSRIRDNSNNNYGDGDRDRDRGEKDREKNGDKDDSNIGDGDYISIYLCCESELPASQMVEARVDFGLFVASASEEFGMERKVCVGRTFRSHGQAMGFRRHTRRGRLRAAGAALYARDKDELVVGAHVVAPAAAAAAAAASAGAGSRDSSDAGALSQISGQGHPSAHAHDAAAAAASPAAGAARPAPAVDDHPASSPVSIGSRANMPSVDDDDEDDEGHQPHHHHAATEAAASARGRKRVAVSQTLLTSTVTP